MKTLVGVDLEESYKLAVELCKRLAFPDQHWIFTNAVPLPLVFAPGIYFDAAPMADSMKYWRESGEDALKCAQSLVGKEPTEAYILDGDATASLLRAADEHAVDLLAVGAGKPDHGVMWVIGSVSRALSYGARQSLLVAKPHGKRSGPIHAVFATDHSEYAEKAAEKLIQWNPTGIGKLDIVTAYEFKEKEIEKLIEGTQVDAEFEAWIRDHAEKEGNRLAEKFRSISPEVSVTVRKGDADNVIRDMMKETDADLLILGAQGHGFIERLLVGSTSLHQLVTEPYPVLLIRL